MNKVIQKLTISEKTQNLTIQQIKAEVSECVLILYSLGYKDVMDKHYEVRFSTRGTKNYANIKRIPERTNYYLITVNKNYMENANSVDFHNTIMHECCHSVDGCMNHGENWKRVAAKVNENYTYSPITRLGNSAEYRENYMNSQYKWKIRCNGCNSEWRYMRRTSTMSACMEGRARCNKCGSKSFSVFQIQ